MSGKGSEAASAAATTGLGGGFRPFVEAVPDGIVIADIGGRILYVNRLAEELSGYQGEELIGLAVESLVPEQFRRAHSERRTGYASRPHPRPMGSGLALHLLRKDGIELPVDIALSPIDTEVGVIIVTSIRAASDRAPRNADAGQRAVDRLQAITDVTNAILEGQTGDQVLRLIADIARKLVGAAQAGVATPESPGGPMVVRAAPMSPSRSGSASLGSSMTRCPRPSLGWGWALGPRASNSKATLRPHARHSTTCSSWQRRAWPKCGR